MEKAFTTTERKKEAEKIFKEKILPFFKSHGFSRHTKTAKRIFKEFDNQLAVFIFFEYKNRFGRYDITIAYFDEELGNVYDDNYLAMANLNTGSYSGDNIQDLNLSVDQWLLKLLGTVIPFIEEHITHNSILESDQFYISKAREKECLDLLKRKTKL